MTRAAPLLVSLALLCAGCPASPPPHVPAEPPAPATEAPAEAPAAHACCEGEAPAAAAPLPDDSLYQVETPWTDAQGVEVRLADLRGHPRLVAMVYTTCAYACPRTLADLQAIEARLSPAARPRLRVVLASYDAANDTPARLAAYAEEQGLDARWTLLHGDADAVRELAAVLGVKYKPIPDGGFAHSNLITLLDADGRVLFRQEGLGADPAAMVAALERALLPAN